MGKILNKLYRERVLHVFALRPVGSEWAFYEARDHDFFVNLNREEMLALAEEIKELVEIKR